MRTDFDIFQDCLNPLCSCETEDTSHRAHLMNSVKSVCDHCESMSDNVKKNVPLYGDSHFNEVKNRFILEATITYIKDSERLSGYLFD